MEDGFDATTGGGRWLIEVSNLIFNLLYRPFVPKSQFFAYVFDFLMSDGIYAYDLPCNFYGHAFRNAQKALHSRLVTNRKESMSDIEVFLA